MIVLGVAQRIAHVLTPFSSLSFPLTWSITLNNRLHQPDATTRDSSAQRWRRSTASSTSTVRGPSPCACLLAVSVRQPRAHTLTLLYFVRASLHSTTPTHAYTSAQTTHAHSRAHMQTLTHLHKRAPARAHIHAWAGSNEKDQWVNDSPMTCMERLIEQAKIIKDINPDTKIWVYRESVAAQPW